MSDRFKLFTKAQLNALNEKQRKKLWKTFEDQIRTSREIRRILLGKLRPEYTRLKPED
jgi:hypothetical protein